MDTSSHNINRKSTERAELHLSKDIGSPNIEFCASESVYFQRLSAKHHMFCQFCEISFEKYNWDKIAFVESWNLLVNRACKLWLNLRSIIFCFNLVHLLL